MRISKIIKIVLFSYSNVNLAVAKSMCPLPTPNSSAYLSESGYGSTPEEAKINAINSLAQFLGASMSMVSKTDASNLTIESESTIETNWDSRLPGIEQLESCQINSEWLVVVGINRSTMRKMIQTRQEARIKMLELASINPAFANVDSIVLTEAEVKDKSLWILTGSSPLLFPPLPINLLAIVGQNSQASIDSIKVQDDDELAKKTVFSMQQHRGEIGNGFSSTLTLTWICKIDSGIKTNTHTRIDATCRLGQSGKQWATHNFSGFAPTDDILTSAVNGITESIERRSTSSELSP